VFRFEVLQPLRLAGFVLRSGTHDASPRAGGALFLADAGIAALTALAESLGFGAVSGGGLFGLLSVGFEPVCGLF
jgi:hypothetical protein